MLVFNIFPRTPYYFSTLEKNKQLAEVGTYIDKNSTQPVTTIALNYWDMQFLPGVSAQTRLISFREEKEYNPHNYFFSIDEIHERIYVSNTIRSLDNNVSADERCSLLEQFGVKYVLTDSENVYNFKNIINKCKFEMFTAFETEQFILLEIK
jgi:hypothetical protein